jgi:hypothetical protein
MKWIKFSERWPEPDKRFLYLGHDFNSEDDWAIKIVFGAPETIPTKEIIDEQYIYRKVDPNDYWMPLPNKPEVNNE